MKIRIPIFSVLIFPLCATLQAANSADERPNILILLSDDLGYADVGFQGCKDIPTPNIDRLAANGVRFTNGYVSGALCSPTRAGLMTGRYQSRFGHDNNVWYDPNDHREGLPTSETLLPEYLRKAGYVTGWIGKWHLGAAPEFRPERRGFMETFGFLGGGHNYDNYQDWKAEVSSGTTGHPDYNLSIERNGKPVGVTRHLTYAFGDEGADFIRRHNGTPWFLYFAPNAPHHPLQPTPERLAEFKSIPDLQRRKYAALVSELDDAIGTLLGALRDTGQEKRTLIFFFSDNGGPISGRYPNGSSNLPLREGKGTAYEGGVRVPFVASWPDKLPEGSVYDHPVISLDIFPTALALAGMPMPTDKVYDGVNLMPYLLGETSGTPHGALYWRLGDGRQTAIRDAKLVRKAGQPAELFLLSHDTGEASDQAATQPDEMKKLQHKLDAWSKPLPPPAFPGLEARRKPDQAKASQGNKTQGD